MEPKDVNDAPTEHVNKRIRVAFEIYTLSLGISLVPILLLFVLMCITSIDDPIYKTKFACAAIGAVGVSLGIAYYRVFCNLKNQQASRRAPILGYFVVLACIMVCILSFLRLQCVNAFAPYAQQWTDEAIKYQNASNSNDPLGREHAIGEGNMIPGKLAIVILEQAISDTGRYVWVARLSDLHFRLPSRLRASTPNEARIVAILTYSESLAGHWVSSGSGKRIAEAYSTSCRIMLWDTGKKELLSTGGVGGDPEHPTGGSLFSTEADAPIGRVADYLKSLKVN